MKKYYRRLMTLMMTILTIMAFGICVDADNSQLEADYTGKTVILSTNDVHGAIDGYQYAAGLKEELEKRGADVIMVDAGDYLQGSSYVFDTQGRIAVDLMIRAGYDYITIGNHEFDYGLDDNGDSNLDKNLKTAMDGGIEVLCCNILNDDDNLPKYQGSGKGADIYTDPVSGLKIGFLGVATPESQSKTRPGNFSNIHFPADADKFEVIQNSVDRLRDEGADIVIAITHLGVADESAPEHNRSIDVLDNVTGIDLVLDGHSHDVMEAGSNGEPIMSTGTKFMYIGVTVVDESRKTIEDRFLFGLKEFDEKGNVRKDDQNRDLYCSDLTSDAGIGAAAQEVIDRVNAQYADKIAVSEVDFNGEKGDANKPGNRVGETNTGDLVTDAMLWYYQKSAADSDLNSDTDRNYKDAVAIFNGGGIRAPLYKGDVTKRSIFEVIPYGNTICGVKVTGKQLLEVLEASTFCTPDPVGGFPQIAGMKITIDTWKEFDKGDLYPKTTFHRPNSINRVTINEINGKPFDKNATYVVVTGNFCADGGDTYFVLANCERFDTGYTVEYAVGDYVTSELGGVIGSAYAAPKDRITVFTTKKDAIKNIKNQEVKGLKVTAKKGGKAVVSCKSLGSGYKYAVMRSTKKSSGYKTVATTGKTKVTVKGMKKGKTYYYKVKAYKMIDGKKVSTKASSAVKVKAK